MSQFADRVRERVLERKLLAAGDSVLVAVSGGLDSIVLLDVLHDLAAAQNWNLAVAHFNHQLRGRSSDADERFVRQTAERLGLPFKAGRAKVRDIAAQRGLSIEMAARQCRHQFLADAATALQMRKVALAHHADDQVELFFLRLFRGAGPEGLSGMRCISLSPANRQVELIRPMLSFTRAEIEAAASDRRLRHRVDVSNNRRDHERNRIRHELLPHLQQFRPGFKRMVLRLVEILAAESDFVEGKTPEASIEPGAEFESLHLALQRRWLRSECMRLGFAPDFELVEALRTRPGQPVMLDAGRIVCRNSTGKIVVREPTRPKFRSGNKVVDLAEGEGSTTFAGVTFAWRIGAWTGWALNAKTPMHTPMRERFDGDTVGSPIRLRHWQPGDRFQPIGMPASVKLQDLFVNLKVPPTRRRKLVVAETAGGEIFWVDGMRIGESFKIRQVTTRCLEWRWRPARAGDL